MPHTIVDDEQAKIIADAGGEVEIRDQRGRCLGYLTHGFTEDDIAIAKERLASNQPYFTTREVLDHLKSLEASKCDIQ